jgi:hypothetical protein
MATSVGGLAVVVSADPSPLEAGLKKATTALDTFGRKAKDILAGLAFGGIGGAFGMAGPWGQMASVLTNFTTGAIESVRLQSKMADATALTTSQFQALTAAAGPMEEAMGRGLQFLARNLGQLRMGKTQAEDKFGALGIDTDQLKRLSTDEAFTAIAERISKMGTASDRAAAAFQIFGRRGQELLPILKQGAAGVEELKEKAHELGLVLDEADNERVTKVAQRMDRLKRLRKSAENFAATAVGRYVEAADDAYDAVRNIARGLGGKEAPGFGGLSGAFGVGLSAGGQGSDAEANVKFTQTKRKLDDELISLEQNQVLRLQRQMDKDNLNDTQQNEVREKFAKVMQKKVDNATQSLQDEVYALNLSPEQLKRRKLLDEGATPDQLGAFDMTSGLLQRNRALAGVREFNRALDLEIDSIGKTKSEIELLKMARGDEHKGIAALTASQLALTKSRLDERDALQLHEQMRPAITKFADDFRHLANNLQVGDKDRALKAAELLGQAERGVQFDRYQAVAGHAFDTAGAFSAIFRASAMPELTGEQRLVKLQEENNQLQARQVQLGEEVIRALREKPGLTLIR